MLLAQALRRLHELEENSDRRYVLVQNLKLPEKLAKTHLRIEFLTTCRKFNLTPRFISDALKPVTSIFAGLHKFDARCDSFSKYLLNGAISNTFKEKAYLERLQRRLYQDLCALNLKTNVFYWIKSTCKEIFCSTIDFIRPRLEKKFLELKRIHEKNKLRPQGFDNDHDVSSSAGQSDIKRVNNISSIPLEGAAENLLSHGPKFGITPSVNGSLLRDVERSVERFAYRKRWADKIISDRETRADRDAVARTSDPDISAQNQPAQTDASVAQHTSAAENGAAVRNSNSQLLAGVRFPDANKTQPPPSTREEEEQLSRLKNDIMKIYRCHKSEASNISRDEQEALQSLKGRDDIIIKPSDKCKGFVILNKEEYVEKAKSVLSDRDNYERLDKDITSKVEAKVKRAFKQCTEGKLPDKVIEDFTPRHSRTPLFYGLPKDHKTSVPLRPVVSNCGGPTEKASVMLEKILHQLIEFVPLHLTDTDDFLQKLREFWDSNDVPENAIFFSVDVVNLYGSIPLDGALEAVREALETHFEQIDSCGLSVQEICSLLEECLKNSVFRFGDEFYLQKQGVAMGNPVAPIVAILFMHRFESLALENAPLKPSFIVRYIDDFAGVWVHGKSALNEFVEYLNSIDSRIQFTCEMTEEGTGSVPMLDTLITLTKDRDKCKYSSELYIKPNNAGIILHYKSAHPKRTKTNLLRAQLRRAIRLSSDEGSQNRSMAKISDLFKKNGYPSRLIGRVSREVMRDHQGRRGGRRRAQRQSGRETTDARSRDSGNFLTLPYVDETVLCKVKKAVLKSKLKVRLGWYAPNTLKKTLVSSELTKPPCPSGTKFCQTCAVISSGRCTDKNVVYEIVCNVCGSTYIGESKRPLRLRFNEHVRSMLAGTEFTPLGDHFRLQHPEVTPNKFMLGIKVLRRTMDHPDRKILESIYIRERKPPLNENLTSWALV